jgi:hypothetical protein
MRASLRDDPTRAMRSSGQEETMTVFDQMAADLELAGYAERTRALYLRAVNDLAVFHVVPWKV